MEDVRNLAVKILDECRERIQSNMARHYSTANGERWVNASGRSSEAFQVESDDRAAYLVYRGDDVAPFESIEHGTDKAPTYDEAAEWRDNKLRSGASSLPSPEAIVKGITQRGTERFREPQEWIVTPELEKAREQLLAQLPSYIAETVRADVFF